MRLVQVKTPVEAPLPLAEPVALTPLDVPEVVVEVPDGPFTPVLPRPLSVAPPQETPARRVPAPRVAKMRPLSRNARSLMIAPVLRGESCVAF